MTKPSLRLARHSLQPSHRYDPPIRPQTAANCQKSKQAHRPGFGIGSLAPFIYTHVASGTWRPGAALDLRPVVNETAKCAVANGWPASRLDLSSALVGYKASSRHALRRQRSCAEHSFNPNFLHPSIHPFIHPFFPFSVLHLSLGRLVHR